MKPLFFVALVFWTLVTLSLAGLAVWSVFAHVHPLLSVVAGLLAVAFGYAGRNDFRTAYNLIAKK